MDNQETLLLDADQRYAVNRHAGIAFRFDRNETQPDADTEWSGYEIPTGNVVMVMVGDDREYIIDPADCTALAEDAYCPGCGQIGCACYR